MALTDVMVTREVGAIVRLSFALTGPTSEALCGSPGKLGRDSKLSFAL